MKASFLFAGLLTLSVIAGCSRQEQPSQNSQPANNQGQAQPQSQPSVATAERATPAEAKAMLQKAVEHYQAAGPKQALADFSAKKAPFADRDLYVFCVGANSSTLTANGAFPHYVGMSVDVWKDADGKPLGKAIKDAARNSDEGSTQYRMINPVSGRIEPKISFWKNSVKTFAALGLTTRSDG